jgi:hypothetical protein
MGAIFRDQDDRQDTAIRGTDMRICIAIVLLCGGLLLPCSVLAAKANTYECRLSSKDCIITCFASGASTPVFKTEQGASSATLTMLEGNPTAFELAVTYPNGRSDIFIGTGSSQCSMTNFSAKHP